MTEKNPTVESAFNADKNRKIELNNIPEDKPLSNNKKSLMKLLDRLYIDKHWNYFKKAINFYYPANDYKKYYVGLRSLSSYMGKNETSIVLGEYNEQLINAVFMIHPDEYKFEYKGVSKEELVAEHENFANKKLAYFIFFDENENLIYKRFMRNIKCFDVRIKKEITTINNITVLTAPKNKIPSNFKSLSNVIELSDLKKHVRKLKKFEKFKSTRVHEYTLREDSINEIVELLHQHFRTLDSNFQIEIPYGDIIDKMFTLEKFVCPYTEFLEIIKYLAFFHQKQRDSYKIKKADRNVILAHINDFIFAYEIAKHLFMTPIPNLPSRKLKFFNSLVREATVIMKKDRISNIFDIQLGQAYITSECKGKKTTLISWLKEFCDELGLLTRNQYMKNALVSYSLNKIAPLNKSDLSPLISRIKRAYDARIQHIKSLSNKKNPKINFFPIND